MQRLSIEPTVPYVIRPGPITVLLAGCGGTGSHLAQSLARLAAHLRDRALLRLIFMDGDVVEPKNVGRQLFGPSDIGQNKAAALAARFNHLFGLDITAAPIMATVDSLRAIVNPSPHRRAEGNPRSVGILVGAVDTAVARKSLHSALANQAAWNLWLDCGNHEHDGQVVVGSTVNPVRIQHGAIKHGICAQLPAPSLCYPDLLEATERRRREDCAAAMEDNVQSLMVNQAMAAVAAEYLAQLVIHRRLTHFETAINLTNLSMRSTAITASALAAVVARYAQRQQRKEAA